jgi:hypothetical protein
MAAITNIEYVTSVMAKKKMPYWIVYDDKTKVNQNDDEKSPINSAKELVECIDNLEGGYVEVSISSKTGEQLKEGGDIKNTVLRYTVRCGSNAKKSINGAPAQNNAELIALITENVELKFQNKIESLEAQLKDYEEEETINGVEQSPTDKLIDMLLPHAPAVIGKLLNIEIPAIKPTTTLAGTDEKQETKTTTETSHYTPEEVIQFKKAAQAAKILHKADAYFGDRLLGLSILAKYDINTYNMASNYLNGMLEQLKTSNPEVKAFFDGK